MSWAPWTKANYSQHPRQCQMPGSISNLRPTVNLRCLGYDYVMQKKTTIAIAKGMQLGAIVYTMTSSNGNIFRVAGHLCGEFTGPPVNSPHNGQWRRALMYHLICAWINGWVNNSEAGDLRHHHAHYNVIVMGSETQGGAMRRCPSRAIIECRNAAKVQPLLSAIRTTGVLLVCNSKMWQWLIVIMAYKILEWRRKGHGEIHSLF